jgi:hypothetical protein
MASGLVLWTGTVVGSLSWLNSRLPRDYERRHAELETEVRKKHDELEQRQRWIELWAVKQGYEPPRG